MPTIEIRFPGGRYHATPWGHHVNEGQIEWPPCPWRLLRALIATGFAKQHWLELPDVARSLIERLASVLPTYELPPVSAAHSRHYMPTGELSKGSEKSTLVFDTWANVEDGVIKVRWDCELDEEQLTLFARLVESLGYLGRSESWVEASGIPDDFELAVDRLAAPLQDGEIRGPGWEQISLMAAVPAEAYARWSEERATDALKEHPLPEGKKKPTKALLKKRDQVLAPYPPDLADCLQKDTAWWKKQHNWSQPPGSQRVLYWRRANSLVVAASRDRSQRNRKRVEHRIEAMLLSLSTPSRNSSALPHVTRTLPQAELIHRVLVSRAGRGGKVDCPEITGQNEHGKPLREGHQHAHVLPLDLDGDLHLDHVLVFTTRAEQGGLLLGEIAQQAVAGLRKTWTKGRDADLQVSLIGRGPLDSLRHLPDPLTPAINQLLGPANGTTDWISATPFVPPRYLKRNGKNTLEGQIASELASRGLPELVSVELLDQSDSDSDRERARTLRHHVRVRRHGGGAPPLDVGFALKIELACPCPGPLLLGYGSHFGLGLFQALDE
ncbi:MAG: type I-U CRISPR-associated protein Csb2 [Planctomycetota bacterium]|nr:type I-U CRISPR-associated protein Csb2 [Planctomycetota bacterium]